MAAALSTTATAPAAPASTKLWGGRFTGATDPLMEAFNNSISFDKRLWRADITGSVCYARALQRCGILTSAEAVALTSGLERVGGRATQRASRTRGWPYFSCCW